MAEIKIPEPKYATKRVHIDTIMPSESRETIRDNKVVVKERSLRKHGRLFIHGGYDPLQHAVCDVWGR